MSLVLFQHVDIVKFETSNIKVRGQGYELSIYSENILYVNLRMVDCSIRVKTKYNLVAMKMRIYKKAVA